MFSFPRSYRLTPDRAAADDFVSQLRIGAAGAGRTVLLPYSSGLGYFVVPTRGADPSIATEDFRVERLSLPLSLWVRMRLALLFRRKKYLRFQDFSLFSAGVKPERKRFTFFNKQMLANGIALDGDFVTNHPELLTGWPAIEAGERAAPALGATNQFAIVAHVYYEDTWPDIAEVLKRLKIPFDLIVTTVPGRDRLIAAIRQEFSQADIRVTENRGRDVRPFLELLEAGRFDGYRFICKIHGKKSTDGGRMPYLGAYWRRRLFFDLLAAPNIARSILDQFDLDPTIGMIGSRTFHLPSATIPLEPSWAKTRPRVLELATRMGVPPQRFRLDFYAGTMFWVRPEALSPLRNLRLASAFPEEHDLLDGGLEHVTERLFSTAVVAAGYRLADSDELTVPEEKDRKAFAGSP